MFEIQPTETKVKPSTDEGKTYHVEEGITYQRKKNENRMTNRQYTTYFEYSVLVLRAYKTIINC